MDLYEYQGKELFQRFGIPVSEGRLATTPQEARAAAEELGGQVVVKAQVLTGGRGKAGGVKLADGPADAEQRANDILGLDIRGHVVRRLWIEQASDIAKEYYLSVTFDRGAKKPLFMFTTQGGVEIEQVAEENPDALVRLHVDPLEGFQPWIARRLVYGAGVEDPGEQKQIASIVEKLYRCFVEADAMLAEINPLIVTPEGEVRALDSKFTVDDALEVITRDEDVRSIFFNISGGITPCDEVARGILQALERLDMSRYPIVVRLDGTNAEEARRILAEAGRDNIYPEATMLDGARRAVEL